MICNQCGCETNPVNLEGSIVECVKCRYRQHVHLPDLDVGEVRADLNKLTAGEMPPDAYRIFEEDMPYDA